MEWLPAAEAAGPVTRLLWKWPHICVPQRLEVCVEFCPRRSGPHLTFHCALGWRVRAIFINVWALTWNQFSKFCGWRPPLSYETFQTWFLEDKVDGSWSRLNRYPEPWRLTGVCSGYRLQTSKTTDLKVSWMIGGASTTSHLIAAYGALTSKVTLCERIISCVLPERKAANCY